MTESIAYLSASDLRDLYRTKALSPVEVTRAILDRIERLNPALNAFTVVTAELALNQARAAERAYAAGDAPPLAGVPTSIKDLTPTRGIRTARGSLIDAGWIPEDDAPVVERLYAAGAVMLGKTNTPELGWKGDSGNRVFGPSFNPWNLAKDTRRIEWRRGGGRRRRSRSSRAGERWRRLDPHPGCVLWHLRIQAVVWPGAAVSAECSR